MLAEVKLGEPNAYWRTELKFEDDGATVRISATEDSDKKKDAYYLAFAVDGQMLPVWGSVGWKGARLPGVGGQSYKVEISNKMAYIKGHEEQVVLTVRRERDGRVVKEFTAGELEKAIWDTALPLSQPLLGREFRAAVMQDVTSGRDGKVAPVPGKYTVYLGAYKSYQYDGGKTAYQFDQSFSFSLEDLQKVVYPKYMKQQRKVGKDTVFVTYGFHVENGVLQVSDISEPPHHALLLPPRLPQALEPENLEIFQGL